MSADLRKIIHVDMDAFYASVEQRENPAYRGKPVIVGGKPNGRGVVCAASYEARKFGVRSAMSSAVAGRLCPDGIFLKPRISFYAEVSRQIMEIFRRFTDDIEPLSLDEAYLDVTANKLELPYATEVAKLVRQAIFEETQLTASAGVAPNKFLAKIASDMKKPNGLFVIRPEQVQRFLADLPVRKVPGIGRVTEEKMIKLGVFTTGDLQKKSEEELIQLFGKSGSWFYRISRGIDERKVQASRKRKSLSAEDTFAEDILDVAELWDKLARLSHRVLDRLERRQFSGKTITLKVTYSDFDKVTRSRTFERFIEDAETLEATSRELLEQTEAGLRPIRLLGISVSNPPSEENSAAVNELNTDRQLCFPFVSPSIDPHIDHFAD